MLLNSPGKYAFIGKVKLLNIQNFPMGNFEVDTSVLPYGIYDVTIETVIDGKIVTTQHQTINKSFGAITGGFDKLNWEIYGGYIDFDKRNYVKKGSTRPNSGKFNQTSFAYNFPVLSGVRFQMSNYGFDKFVVQETSINAALNNYISVNWQGMLENHGSYRNIATLSVNIPEGYGSLWASKEKL